jgi:GrpB-like predicted nucleotidyltransferase (UPF0157 family)
MLLKLVENYNPEWPKWFKSIIDFLGEDIRNLCQRIEHVGSTSVPGMIAKPIIDLDLVIRADDFNPIKILLEKRGYFHEGDKGIKDRDSFALISEETRLQVPKHHLYVCPGYSQALLSHIAFRECLKTHQSDAKRLSNLKWKLAEQFNNDKYPYMDGKKNSVEN